MARKSLKFLNATNRKQNRQGQGASYRQKVTRGRDIPRKNHYMPLWANCYNLWLAIALFTCMLVYCIAITKFGHYLKSVESEVCAYYCNPSLSLMHLRQGRLYIAERGPHWRYLCHYCSTSA